MSFRVVVRTSWQRARISSGSELSVRIASISSRTLAGSIVSEGSFFFVSFGACFFWAGFFCWFVVSVGSAGLAIACDAWAGVAIDKMHTSPMTENNSYNRNIRDFREMRHCLCAEKIVICLNFVKMAIFMWCSFSCTLNKPVLLGIVNNF